MAEHIGILLSNTGTRGAKMGSDATDWRVEEDEERRCQRKE